jgi:hypothetical protein
MLRHCHLTLPLLLLCKQAMDCQLCQGTIIHTAAAIVIAQASKGGTTNNAKALLSMPPPPPSLLREQVEDSQ